MSGVAAAAQNFSSRLHEFLRLVEYRRAASASEKDEIYRLRYDAYVREGALTPSRKKFLTDAYDEDARSWLFGVYIEDVLASSIRISVASPEHPDSPAVSAFRDVLGPELEAGRTIVDPNRFVADHVISRLYPALPYATVRLGFVASEYFNADLGLATARVEHQAFYKRVFGLEELCPARPYPTLIKPLSLMGIRYRDVREEILRRYPSFGSTYTERAMLFDRSSGWEPADGEAEPQAQTGTLTLFANG